jgi:hypothetical protein
MRRWSTSCPRFIGNSCWFMRITATKRARHRFAPWNAPSRSRWLPTEKGLASEAKAALRKARKYTDAAVGKLSAPVTGTKQRNQSASTHKHKRLGCGSFDHGYKEFVYRIHPYFNADPSIEYAQSPMGIRYYNKYGGRYIKERDMDHTMHKNDRGGSMQRKRLRQEDLAALPSKSLGRDRAVCVSK